MFSSITSFSTGVDVLIGIGALLGASVFVTTIVVGSVSLLSPSHVDRAIFTRDISFHFISVTSIALISIIGRVKWYGGPCLFCLYLLYVSVVVSGVGISKKISSTLSERGLQQAFWHPSTKKRTKASQAPTPSVGASKINNHSTNKLSSKKKPPHEANFGYKFLILNEDTTTKEEAKGVDEDEHEITINLSGGLMVPEFEHDIIEDYFSLPKDATPQKVGHESLKPKFTPFDGMEVVSGRKPKISNKNNSSFVSNYFGWFIGQGSNGITNGSDYKRVIGEDGVGGGGGGVTGSVTDGDEDDIDDDEDTSDDLESSMYVPNVDGSLNKPLLLSPARRNKNRKGRQGANMALASLYYQQWQVRRRLKKHLLTAEWWSYPWHSKIFAIIESPIVLLRDVTIPTIDPELWFKPYAVLQPLLSPMLLLFIFGDLNSHVGFLPSSVLSFILGVPLAIFVYLTTHYSYPMKGSVYGTTWVLLAFSMCIAWIYLLAGELVACLSAIGDISGLPPAVLGLTVLAWGNSVGDLFANIAVAKQGLGEMAMAGCYGGPVFNLLIGLGVSFSYVCSLSYPNDFEVAFDISTKISLGFLFFILPSTYAIIFYSDFHITPMLGYYLLSVYGIYTVMQLLALIFM